MYPCPPNKDNFAAISRKVNSIGGTESEYVVVDIWTELRGSQSFRTPTEVPLFTLTMGCFGRWEINVKKISMYLDLEPTYKNNKNKIIG